MSARPIIPDVWYVGRSQFLVGQAVTAVADADDDGKDISAAAFTVRFRAWQQGADSSYLKNVTLSKDSATGDVDAGDSGYFSGYCGAFTTSYGKLRGEIVLVDSGNADAGTPTGYREAVLESREFKVVDTAT